MGKRNFIVKKLNNILKNKKIGEITSPLKYPNGYLILKINKKEMEEILSFDDELKELINFERINNLTNFHFYFTKK